VTHARTVARWLLATGLATLSLTAHAQVCAVRPGRDRPNGAALFTHTLTNTSGPDALTEVPPGTRVVRTGGLIVTATTSTVVLITIGPTSIEIPFATAGFVRVPDGACGAGPLTVAQTSAAIVELAGYEWEDTP